MASIMIVTAVTGRVQEGEMERIISGLKRGDVMVAVKRVTLEEIVLRRAVATGEGQRAGDSQNINGFGVHCTEEIRQNVAGQILVRS